MVHTSAPASVPQEGNACLPSSPAMYFMVFCQGLTDLILSHVSPLQKAQVFMSTVSVDSRVHMWLAVVLVHKKLRVCGETETKA